jgi:uncharacterized protein (DUF779 family)
MGVLETVGAERAAAAEIAYPPQQVLTTPAAVELIEMLQAKHGPVMPQFEYWKHTQLILDVVPGRGGMFSLENGEGVRFLIRSRVFTDAEIAALRAAGRI